ncbi:GreA/GreB family elongation factor [Pendulispora albinea]|uniref:GreA/GreB family elongation factor n=1 Tax=Pendulispora albinea TaxID=2741071 RepID=A0ABZ2MBT1_9BACT
MSKAFTKDDAEDEPLVVPRPPLPAGSPNYVTPRGLARLRAELRQLDTERAHLEAQPPEPDRVRALTILHARIHELGERIASAVPVDPRTQPRDEIRFGATITVRGETGPARHYEIVGVDEADAAHGRLAFSAPLARALLGKRAGDVIAFRTPRGEEELEIVAIDYAGEA